MRVMFATCNVVDALDFINQAYPSCEDLTVNDVPKLVALLKEDIVRVQDPNLHNPPQIVSGKNYDSKYDFQINEAVKELLNHPKLNKLG